MVAVDVYYPVMVVVKVPVVPAPLPVVTVVGVVPAAPPVLAPVNVTPLPDTKEMVGWKAPTGVVLIPSIADVTLVWNWAWDVLKIPCNSVSTEFVAEFEGAKAAVVALVKS